MTAVRLLPTSAAPDSKTRRREVQNQKEEKKRGCQAAQKTIDVPQALTEFGWLVQDMDDLKGMENAPLNS